MAVSNPSSVPQKDIASLDISGFSGGLYLNGDQTAAENQFVSANDVEMTIDSALAPRRSMQRWLPETVEKVYEVFPALTDNEIVYFTADDGKVKYARSGDGEWTDCGGDNEITTQNGGKPTFLRVLDKLLLLNGRNGDKLSQIDLETKEVIKYEFVDDPTDEVSISGNNIALSGDHTIYYAYTYSSATGETMLSPIKKQEIEKPRDTWDPNNNESLTISRPSGTPPSGAENWNLYVALASHGGSISDSDMLMLVPGIDLDSDSVVDNGSLVIDIGRGTPPEVNSTDGPRVDNGIETNGRPVLFDDVDSPYNIWIGGDGELALSFSPSSGGFRAEVSKGTNYYPASVIGFRNGQGIPSLTILFSNTEGLSKQATLEQQTIDFGNQSLVVWGVTEQYYGAAGVASPKGVVNYRGQLTFPSTDGFTSMDTEPQVQNVISTRRIDDNIRPAVTRIRVSALSEIVGTAWDNKVAWIVPADGFEEPNQIWIRDLNNDGAWYRLSIPAQWIGVVSPPDSPAFVYICQDNKIYKLFDAFGTLDYLEGGAETFSTNARGPLMGFNEAHTSYMALVQTLFYLSDFSGTITVGVTYRNRSGRLKSRSRTYEGLPYSLSSAGGWSDPHYTYAHFDAPARWSDFSVIDDEASVLQTEDVRIRVPVNDLTSEVQWWYNTPKDFNTYKLLSVSFQGENLGINPDLR